MVSENKEQKRSLVETLGLSEKEGIKVFLGFFDPLLMYVADALSDRVPGVRLVQNKYFQSFIGSLRGFLEARAEKFPLLAEVGVTILLDFTRLLQQAVLTNNDGGAELDKLFSEKIGRVRADLNSDSLSQSSRDRLQTELDCYEGIKASLRSHVDAQKGRKDSRQGPAYVFRALAMLDDDDRRNLMRRNKEAVERGRDALLLSMLSEVLTGELVADLEILRRLNGISDDDFETSLTLFARRQ